MGEWPRIVVGVAVDQFLFRTALHAALAADGRFDAHLCPLGEDAVTHAREYGARMLIASRPFTEPDLCVVIVSHLQARVQISYTGGVQDLVYDGMASLRDQLSGQAYLHCLHDEAS
jgi:hypothetical protein